MITPYVTIFGRKEFERNKTGFGCMVYDIAKAIGAIEEVEVLATNSRGGAFDIGEVHYVKRSFSLMLKNIFYCLKLGKMRRLLKQFPVGRGQKIRLWYYWVMTGYVNSLIRNGGYDLVHIHGCALANEFWMSICRKNNVRFVITLHGLNSFSDTVTLDYAAKKYERDFLQRVARGEQVITVISSGIKHTIEAAYDVSNCPNIHVVLNSFSLPTENKDLGVPPSPINIRDFYHLPSDSKLLLYVGNIGRNKNQLQLLQAFPLLNDSLRKKTYVLFLGNPSNELDLQKYIDESPFSRHLIYVGGVDKSQIADYYRVADATILLSYAEGFGLSLIEGMHFGLPCALFTDMDAFNDIYDSCSVVGIKNRSNEEVARSVELLLTKEWDREAISSYSEKFNQDNMASRYIKVFQLVKD